jgi:hypothetical protein
MTSEKRFDRIVRTIRAGHAGLHRAFTANADGARWAGYLLHDCRAWVAVRGAAAPGEHLHDDALSLAISQRLADDAVAVECGALARSLPAELTTVRLCGVVVAVRYLRDLLGVARTAEVLTVGRAGGRLAIVGEGDTWRAGLSSYPARDGAPVVDVGAAS